MTTQEQIKLLQEQIRFLNSTEVEIAARKHKLEISLNRLQDEEVIAKNEAALKRLEKHQIKTHERITKLLNKDLGVEYDE